jgi:acetylornithine deacetylase/succinyl-diaminopimelate desuccinylase-like protein
MTSSVSWHSHDPADIDVISLAKTLVRYDTSHNGEGADTLPMARTLREIWEQAGVESEIIATPKPGNVHFLARISGTGARPPILVLSHSDVVAVQRESWTRDPFAADIADDFLWGRGSLDMKGAGAAFSSALLRHVRAGAQFDRDIIYLADCDEEGGWHGTRWLVQEHWEKVKADAVITEGGWTLADGGDGTSPLIASMTCVDRAFGAIRLIATGTATHSSRPTDDMAIVRLAQAVTRIASSPMPVALTPLNREYFAAVAQRTASTALADAIGALLWADRAGDQPALDACGDAVIVASPYPWLHNAMLRATVAFVSQEGGKRANVIPRQASALLQIRFTPQGQSPDEVLSQLSGLLDGPGVRMEVVGPPGETAQQTLDRWRRDWNAVPAPTDTDVFQAWAKAVRAVYPGTMPIPAMFEAGTSGKPWQERGIPVYGIYPYAVDNATLTAMHGDDERVRISALRRGADLLYHMFGYFRTDAS